MTDTSKEMELPPCECMAGWACASCRVLSYLKVTRDQFTAMKAKAERCELAEAELGVLSRKHEGDWNCFEREMSGLRARVAEVERERDAIESSLEAELETYLHLTGQRYALAARVAGLEGQLDQARTVADDMRCKLFNRMEEMHPMHMDSEKLPFPWEATDAD